MLADSGGSMIDKSSKEFSDLKSAVNILETPSITAKIANLVGSPIELAIKYLPDGAQEKINDTVQVALHKAADAALWSLEKTSQARASNMLHKAMAATTGAIGGAFGFAALAVELPISTTIMLRSIADVARSEGFDLSEFDTKQSCIEVFAFGGSSAKDDATESGYYAARGFMIEATKNFAKELSEIAARNAAAQLSEIAARNATLQLSRVTPGQVGSLMTKVIEAVTSKFGVVITEKVAVQAVPIIGGIAGATLNTLFTDFYQNTAKGHFTIKRLEKKYGFDAVKNQYNEIRGNKF